MFLLNKTNCLTKSTLTKSLTTLCLFLVLGIAIEPTMAQENKASTNSESFRKQVPGALPIKPLDLPKSFETTLPNGLQIVIAEDKRLPLVSLRLAFRSGNFDAPKDLPGLAGIMASMLTKGTTTRSSKQIADEVAALGATLTASTNADYTVISASTLSNYTEKIFALVSDITLNPTFPAKELELLKQNTKQALIAQRGQAAFLARERVAKVLYGEHPYSIISGTPASIDAMTSEKLSSFYKTSFLPNNGVMILVGDIDREAVLKQITNLFGKWQKGEPRNVATNIPAPPVRSTREIYLIDRPGSAQSNIVIGNIALNRLNPDYYAVQVLNTVLGANPSSRLFMNLRESKSYTYGAYSSFDSRRGPGVFTANSEVNTPVTGASLKEFFYEFDRIRNEPVSDKEIKNAKSYLIGTFPLQLETIDGLIAELLSIKMYGLPADYLQTYRDKINTISKEDIQRVARQYINSDKIAIVIVGDAAIIDQQIKPYAEKISLFDISGNPKTAVTSASNNAVDTTPTATPAATTTGAAESVLGLWKVDIAGAGQPITARLSIKQDGDKFTGIVESDLGVAEIVDLSVKGNSFDGTIKFQLQGQNIEGKMDGRTTAGKLNGTINLPNMPQMPFSGERSN